MNKNDLVQAVADEANLSKADAARAARNNCNSCHLFLPQKAMMI